MQNIIKLQMTFWIVSNDKEHWLPWWRCAGDRNKPLQSPESKWALSAWSHACLRGEKQQQQKKNILRNILLCLVLMQDLCQPKQYTVQSASDVGKHFMLVGQIIIGTLSLNKCFSYYSWIQGHTCREVQYINSHK